MSEGRIQAIVQLGAVSGFGATRLNSLFDDMARAGLTLDDLPHCSGRTLAKHLYFEPQQVRQFLDAAPEAHRTVGRIRNGGVTVLARGDAGWPVSFARHSRQSVMPWLFVAGDPGVLGGSAAGVVGSREATARSLEVTRDLVRGLVRHDMSIASGGARGIDLMAHWSALEAGGTTVVVLAQGIGTFHTPGPWREPIRRGQLAVVSEFAPMDAWESFRAIQRNGTIVRLSDALLVIQAGAKSGTLSAGHAALKTGVPLFVATQSGDGAESFPGNEHLIRHGGVPLCVSADGRNVDEMVRRVLEPGYALPQRQAQLRLF